MAPCGNLCTRTGGYDDDEDDEDDEDEDDECSVRVTKNEDTGWEILKDGAQVVER